MCMKFTKEAIQGPLGEIGRHGDLITQNLIRKKCIIILKRGQCRVRWVIKVDMNTIKTKTLRQKTNKHEIYNGGNAGSLG